MKDIKTIARELYNNLPIIQEDYISTIENTLLEVTNKQRAIMEQEAREREETLFQNFCDWLGEHYEEYTAQSRGNMGVAAVMTIAALHEARERGEI